MLSRETQESIRHDAEVESRYWRTSWALLGDTAVLLDVPFKDKDRAKANKARWDSTLKKWYVDNWVSFMLCWDEFVPQDIKDRVESKRNEMRSNKRP